MLTAAFYPALWALSKIPNKYFKKIFGKLFSYMNFNLPLQFIIELYLELTVVLWLNIYAGLRFENKAQMTANGLAICVFTGVTFFPVWAYSTIMKNFDKLHLEEFESKFAPLIECTRMKLNSTVNQMWVPIFLFRRYTYAAIIVVLEGNPNLQMPLIIA